MNAQPPKEVPTIIKEYKPSESGKIDKVRDANDEQHIEVSASPSIVGGN